MDVIYLFDSGKSLRECIVSGISECIHSEADYTLTALIPIKHKAEPGEYLGFICADGRFRLFEIDDTDDDETEGTTTCTCTDAAVSELIGTIVQGVDVTGATPGAAVSAILSGTEWTINATTEGRYTADVKLFIADAWSTLTDVAYNCDVRIIPRFSFSGSGITGRVLDIEARSSAFCGRIFENDVDAQGVSITRSGSPRPMVYGLGATDENDEQLTFEEVEWSIANGDPVDKPMGQRWVGVPSAVSKYPGKGQVYEVPNCKDPNLLLRLTWKEAQKAAAAKVGASATVSDMEMIAGQTWKSIRLYDTVAVHTRRGETIAKVIIGIDRNHAYPERTRITLGEEDERPPNIARDIAQLKAATIRAGRAGGGAGAAAERNYLLLEAYDVRVDEMSTEISSVWIELDAVNTTLTLKAELQDLQETQKRISDAEIRLDGAEADILLKASREEVDDLGERISQAEIDIDGANAAIALKAGKAEVDELDTRVSQAEVDIDGMEADIKLKANQSDVGTLSTRMSIAEANIDAANAEIELKANQTTVNALNTRVSNAELDIDAANSAISLKANQTTVNSLSSRLNQAEIDIDAANSAIALKANSSTVTALTNRVGQAEIDIDGANSAIALKASQESVDGLDERLSQAEIDIDGLEATIVLKASLEDVTGLGDRVSQAEIDIDGANAAIELKASREDVTELGERVSQAEIDIDGAKSEITLKADKVYVDAEITTVKNLVADEIDAAIADLNLSISETIVTNYLTVTGRATLSALALDGSNVSKTTLPIVTSFTQALGESAPTTMYTLLTVA